MEKVSFIYPQYRQIGDRRKVNIPVAIERRSGMDRRSGDRVALDSRLTKDIFEVKSQIAKFETMTPKLFAHNISVQTPSFAEKNNYTIDQFIKETKPNESEILRQEAKNQESADTSFKVGLLTAALVGAVAVSFLGAAGAVIALGSTMYIGAKVFKATVENEMRNNNK